MKKRICATLLILVMVVSLFAGCANEPAGPGSPAWTADGLAAALPQLSGKTANVITNTADNFVVEVGEMTATQYKAYLAACKAAGLDNVVAEYDYTAVLANKAGNMVTLSYKEAESKMSIDLYAPSVLANFSYSNFLNSNLGGAFVIDNLKLPSKFTDKATDTKLNLTWTSSAPEVISAEGKVKRPDTGDVEVILTATEASGAKKSFPVRVLGKDCNNGTMVVNNDYVPATGAGMAVKADTYVFNTTNNSIIADLGESKKVNYVQLTDGDAQALLGTQFVTLWVSEDNAKYTQVKGFKMIQLGTQWYLYDFEAQGRYVKVHYTLMENTEITNKADSGANPGATAFQKKPSEFKGIIGKMIRAGYEEILGSNGAEFKKSNHTLTNNTDRNWFDNAWTISKAELGVTGEPSSLRISANGKALYHYVDGDNVVIRIPDLEKGASLTLDILQSDSMAPMDLANKESVYEVTYGTIENAPTPAINAPRYSVHLKKGTKFPAGNVLEEDLVLGYVSPYVVQSTDGGYTWTNRSRLSDTAKGGKPVRTSWGSNPNYLYDEVSHRLYIAGTSPKFPGVWNRGVYIELVYSDDGGLTWNEGPSFPADVKEDPLNFHQLIYANGTTVKSSYDGKAGDGVDLVYPVGVSIPKGDGTYSGHCTRVAYSRDAGETWQYSDTPIHYIKTNEYEGDCSEGTIVERDDGVLVLYARNQHADVRNFGVSYSIDHGVTWQTQAELSSTYGCNGQPIMDKFEVAGVEDVILLSWMGNNVDGNTKYIRNPSVVGISTNGGETFRYLQNMFFRTPFEKYGEQGYCLYTNHCFTKALDDDLYYAVDSNDIKPDRMAVRIGDFDSWLTRTKGAYDSFEAGLPVIEGWKCFAGAAVASDEYASAGKYSMELRRSPKAIRSIPYFQNGIISMDIYVEAETEFKMEFQSGHSTNPDNKAAPIAFAIKDKKITFVGGKDAIALKDGWNTLCFNLELTKDKAMLSLNGAEAVAIPVDMTIGDYVCYVAIYGESSVYLDEFLIKSDLDVVLKGTDADKQAANAVIEQIKKMDATKASDVQAARAAFEALTQVQQDFVDCKTVINAEGDINVAGTVVNYYDVLVNAEAKLSGAKAG